MTLHIGVIDDDRGILYTLEAMGTTAGWRMHSTTEPEECLSWVRHDEIDMLLVDYHMPVMNGRQIIKRVRALNTRVILIALTVEDDPSLASELILAGADDFITKPVRLADFAARIRLHVRILGHRDQLNWEERKKGVSRDTMRAVMEFVRNAPEPVVCDDAAAGCGLAYVTAHRYLEHLVERGIVIRRDVVVQDGRPGRPKAFYEWRP